MASNQTPAVHIWFRGHHLGGDERVVLSVKIDAEEKFSLVEGGVLNRAKCDLSITNKLLPALHFYALDVQSGQMLLDAHFDKLFPEHNCIEGCNNWYKLGGGEATRVQSWLKASVH